MSIIYPVMHWLRASQYNFKLHQGGKKLNISNYFRILINRCQSNREAMSSCMHLFSLSETTEIFCTPLYGVKWWRIPAHLCLLTVSRCEMFLLLRVSEFLWITASVAEAGISFGFFVFCFFFSPGNVALQSTSVETTFGYFSCATRQTKAHFGPSKCFSLGSRATDAQPNMVRGSAAGTSQPSTTVGNIAITSWPHDPWTGVARLWVVWKKK